MMTGSSMHFMLLAMAIVLAALPNGDASKGIKKVVVQAEDGVMLLPGRKDMNKAKVTFDIPLSGEITRGKVGGRRMMNEGKEVSNEMKKEKSKKAGAAKISGASSVGNTKQYSWQRKLNMQSKLNTSNTRNSNHHHHGKVNMGGFMALNADYHMARAHPPRNN